MEPLGPWQGPLEPHSVLCCPNLSPVIPPTALSLGPSRAVSIIHLLSTLSTHIARHPWAVEGTEVNEGGEQKGGEWPGTRDPQGHHCPLCESVVWSPGLQL